MTAKAGSVIELPVSGLEKDNARFLGWALEDEIYQDTYTIDQDLTADTTIVFTAVWKDKVSAVVRYELNGGTGIADSVTVYDGDTVSLPAGITKAGYRLLGWSETADGTVAEYTDIFTVPDTVAEGEEITLNAVWGKETTLTFDYNNNDTITETITAVVGTDVTFPAVPSVISHGDKNYAFCGWSEEKHDFLAKDDVLPLMISSAEYVMPEADTVLYGVWREVDFRVKVNVQYNLGTWGENYALYETIEADNTVIQAPVYPENMLRRQENKSVLVEGVSADAYTVENDTVTFNRDMIATGTIPEVTYYYEPYYTVTFRFDPSRIVDHGSVRGVTSTFRYGDYLLSRSASGEIAPVQDQVRSYAEAINENNFRLENIGAYRSAYENLIGKQYSEYGSSERRSLDPSVQPAPGATIYYLYDYMSDANNGIITFAQEYLNSINGNFTDPDSSNLWDNMTGASIVQYRIYFGETLTFNFSDTDASTVSGSALNVLDFYKDDTFVLWRYCTRNGTSSFNGRTIDAVEADGDVYSAGTPWVFTATEAQFNFRSVFLYRSSKPVSYTVSYYVDGVQIGETENYYTNYRNQGDIVTVRALPDAHIVQLVNGKAEWTHVCYDKSWNKKTTSTIEEFNPLNVHVKNVPGTTFDMIDGHIKYNATTLINVDYVAESENVNGQSVSRGVVSNTHETANGRSGNV